MELREKVWSIVTSCRPCVCCEYSLHSVPWLGRAHERKSGAVYCHAPVAERTTLATLEREREKERCVWEMKWMRIGKIVDGNIGRFGWEEGWERWGEAKKSEEDTTMRREEMRHGITINRDHHELRPPLYKEHANFLDILLYLGEFEWSTHRSRRTQAHGHNTQAYNYHSQVYS